MLKNPIVRTSIFVALIALIVLIIVDSRREPDYEKLALERIPADCDVLGTWRDTDYHESIQQFRRTVVICDAATSRVASLVFDGPDQEPLHLSLDAAGLATNGDIYTINPDGTLTISDDSGPFKTLE